MENEIKIDHLSWSQISLYLKNPREWWFKYVKYPEDKENFDTWAFQVGREYHSAIECIYKTANLQSALETYDEQIEEHNNKLFKDNDTQAMRQAIIYYFDNIYPMYASLVKPENVELKEDNFMIEGVGVPIQLRIDAFTIDDRIIDHKTVGQFAPKAQGNGQGLLYGLYYYRKYGKVPRKFELHRAYKSPKDSRLVDIDEGFMDLAAILNMQDVVRGVWKSINAGIFYWGLDAYKSPFKDEYDKMLIMEG